MVVLLHVLVGANLASWHLYLASIHLPHFLLLLCCCTCCFQTRRLASLALSCFASDTTRDIRLRRELTSRLLIYVLHIMRLAIVMGGEMRCSCSLMMVWNNARCLATARIGCTTFLSFYVIAVSLASAPNNNIQHWVWSVLSWMHLVNWVDSTCTVVHLCIDMILLLLIMFAMFIEAIELVVLQKRRLLNECLVRLREKIILLDLVLLCSYNLSLISLEVIGIIAFHTFSLGLWHAKHWLLHLLLKLLLVHRELVFIHAGELFCCTLHKRIWFETIHVMRVTLIIWMRLLLMSQTIRRRLIVMHFGIRSALEMIKLKFLWIQSRVTLAACAQGIFWLRYCRTLLHRNVEAHKFETLNWEQKSRRLTWTIWFDDPTTLLDDDTIFDFAFWCLRLWLTWEWLVDSLLFFCCWSMAYCSRRRCCC